MKKYIFLVVALSASLLQVTVFDYLKIFNVRADLLLIASVFAALFMKTRQVLFFCLFCGLLKDIFAWGSFGINTVLFCLWGMLILKLSRQLTIDNDYVRIGAMFIIALLDNIAHSLVTIYSGKFVSVGIFLRVISLGPFYTALIFSIILKIVPFERGILQDD